MCPKGGAKEAKAESRRFQAQVVLQLAQWMAETGQAAKDEITGGWLGGWVGAGAWHATCGMGCSHACLAGWLAWESLDSGPSARAAPPLDPSPPCPPPRSARRPAALFDRATSLEPKSEAVLFRYAVYLDEVSAVVHCTCLLVLVGKGQARTACDERRSCRAVRCGLSALQVAGSAASLVPIQCASSAHAHAAAPPTATTGHDGRAAAAGGGARARRWRHARGPPGRHVPHQGGSVVGSVGAGTVRPRHAQSTAVMVHARPPPPARCTHSTAPCLPPATH